MANETTKTTTGIFSVKISNLCMNYLERNMKNYVTAIDEIAERIRALGIKVHEKALWMIESSL